MAEAKKRRFKSSNITVIFSISLVLFLLGLMGLFILNSEKFSDYIFDQLKVNVFLVDDTLNNEKEEDIAKKHEQLLSELNLQKYTKHTYYISKEQATKEFQKENQNLNIKELYPEGFNIFPASIELALHKEYYTPVRVDSIVKVLETHKMISEATIDGDLVLSAYKNLRLVTFIFLALVVIFLFASIVLINNYIRLRIFSKRFLIKTMQLVGATKWFIIKPFLKEAFWMGFIGAIIAALPIVGIQYLYSYFALGNDDIFTLLQEINLWFILIFVFILGITLTFISTWIATLRYLKLKTEQLYYF